MCEVCGQSPARPPYGGACGPGCAAVFGTPSPYDGGDVAAIVVGIVVAIAVVLLVLL